MLTEVKVDLGVVDFVAAGDVFFVVVDGGIGDVIDQKPAGVRLLGVVDR